MKTREQALIEIHGDYIQVVVSRKSPLLEGSHRIFLVTALGFDISAEISGYALEVVSKKERVINDLVDYFEENKVACKLDGEAERLLELSRGNAELLEEAKKVGTQLKKSPPRNITVPGLKRKLKPYQVPAVAHAVEMHNAANFSVPGSGKTTIVLSAFQILKQNNEVDCLIVIGPRASFMPWEEEYESCFGHTSNSVRVVGSKGRRRQIYRDAAGKEMLLLTYQMAHQDNEDLARLLNKRPCMLVLDESHNIKRLDGGKWSTALLAIASGAKRRVILTGTPVPNSLQDLWSQMTFLWPDPPLLGHSTQFKDRVDGADTETLRAVKRELFPFYWRIRKRDIGLRRPRFHRIAVKMKPYQRAIYDALATRVLTELVKAPEERQKLRVWRRARIVRLLQTASNPTLLKQYSEEFQMPPLDASGMSVSQLIERYPTYETPAKVDAVQRLVTNLTNAGEKVIIWTTFVHNIKMLSHLFQDYHPRLVFGEIPKDENEDKEFNRERMIRQFKSEAQYRLLIANPSACAESISLHRICKHAIYYDRAFNGAQYMQSLDRIHRIGLEPSDVVHYYFLVSGNSVDEVVDSRLSDKLKRMIELLDDDFAVLDLDAEPGLISDEAGEEADFEAIVAHLKKTYG